ncbi:hypothetical protein PUN28_018574 [Cardiocondyla obscurior]|uniref:Uncharacterized protein n=1 Tax=Cardiocondyla obscurior TaxID=286306 RepID=A0AAW2EIQ0_9HYME
MNLRTLGVFIIRENVITNLRRIIETRRQIRHVNLKHHQIHTRVKHRTATNRKIKYHHTIQPHIRHTRRNPMKRSRIFGQVKNMIAIWKIVTKMFRKRKHIRATRVKLRTNQMNLRQIKHFFAIHRRTKYVHKNQTKRLRTFGRIKNAIPILRSMIKILRKRKNYVTRLVKYRRVNRTILQKIKHFCMIHLQLKCNRTSPMKYQKIRYFDVIHPQLKHHRTNPMRL